MAPQLPRGFVMITLGKFLSNVSFRLVFPFLPRIASGLGVSLSTMGTSLAIRELVGVVNPALGRAADRRGHAAAMAVGLGSIAVSMVIMGVSQGLVMFTVGLVCISLAKALFDVAAAAWVGDAVPYNFRGRAIGYLETSWALAFVVGMPLAALIIRATTWRTPFLLAAGACVLVAVAISGTLGHQDRRRHEMGPFAFTAAIRAVSVSLLCLSIGQAMLLVTFATWLEDEHGVSISGLGLTAMIIGLAELAGSGSSAAFSDRLGLERSFSIGLVGSALASVLVTVGSSSLAAAMIVLALYFVVVEFVVVNCLSLFSELDQNSRGTVMGVAFTAFAMGHALGALVGTRIYEEWGMTPNALAMAGTYVVALGVLKLGHGSLDREQAV